MNFIQALKKILALFSRTNRNDFKLIPSTQTKTSSGPVESETPDVVINQIDVAPIPDAPKEAVFKFDHNPLDTIFITQRFGEDPALYGRWNLKGHHGLDFRTKTSTDPIGKQNIYAVLSGTVIQATYNDNNGNFVRLKHEDGGQSVYLHLSALKVTSGEPIEAGELIGISGNTGFSGGPHLHFGYRPSGFDVSDGYMGYVDCEPFLIV